MKNLITVFILVCAVFTTFAQKRKKNSNNYTYTNGKVISLEGDTTNVRFRVLKKGIKDVNYHFEFLQYRKMDETKMLTANVSNSKEMLLMVNGNEERYVPCDIRYQKKVKFFRTITKEGELNVIPVTQVLNMGEEVERSTGKRTSYKTKPGDRTNREENVSMSSYIIRNSQTNESILLVGIKYKKMMNKILEGCPEALALVNLDKIAKKERKRKMIERVKAGENYSDVLDEDINTIIKTYNENCGSN